MFITNIIILLSLQIEIFIQMQHWNGLHSFEATQSGSIEVFKSSTRGPQEAYGSKYLIHAKNVTEFALKKVQK